MLNNLLSVLGVDGIKNIVEIFSRWVPAIWILVLEVYVEFLVVLQVFPQVLYSKLFICRYMDVVYRILLHQLLLVGEYLPEKILVYLFDWWHVILNYKGISYRF